MLNALRQLLARPDPTRRTAAVPAGERWYVIGDVHGRRDLLEVLQHAIETDDAAAAPARTTVVMLGDLVDRGPDSAGVVRLVREWAARREVRCLAGNHEEMFLESFADSEVLRHFLKHGGRETILSYGISERDYRALRMDELREAMADLVPAEDRAFLTGFEEMIVAGDYVFVHAGLNPARALADQTRSDLLWIRERFLSHGEAFSHVVVHGHTIFDEVVDTQHRIGIDTGAFRTGRLTALVLEGTSRRTIQTVAGDDGIVTTGVHLQ